jgi:hypothetical protein
MEPAGVRFADILTTASAVANYLGESDVRAAHLRDAIALLNEETTLDALGRPLSPLVRRAGKRGATGAVRALAQRWFADLGDANALLGEEQLAQLKAQVASLIEAEERGSNAT